MGQSIPFFVGRNSSAGTQRRPKTRVFLVLLALALLGAGRAFADPPHPGTFDPEERQRFRRELREAHRDRLNGARDQAPPGVPGYQHPGAAFRSDTEPPRPPPNRFRQHDTGSRGAELGVPRGVTEPEAPGSARMPLSDEERAKLRRQIRDQRVARRVTPPAAPTESEPNDAPSRD